jgi:glycosyltransferase involved in cell wall biosynthesis
MIRYLRAGDVPVEVVYATDITARGYEDEGFGRKVEWDMPLLEGYPYRVLFPNDDLPCGLRQLRRYRRALGAAFDEMRPDAVWVHGWGNAYPLAALLEARRRRLPVLMRGETSLECLHGGKVRRALHHGLLSVLFRGVSQFLAIGKANQAFYRHHGVAEGRIHLMPYAVDNTFFQQRCQAAASQRERLRAALGIEPGRPVILFCAKLIGVKDPATLIHAIGLSAALNPLLLMAGDGALSPEMEELARKVAPGMVKFLGFRNQTELPALYDLCDVFVLPSVFEPWGLVVNEVMNAGKPVIVSNKVGSGHDLVQPGVNGDVFQAGNVEDLLVHMRPWLEDAGLRSRGGQESLRIINSWGFDQSLAGLQAAINALNLP